MSFSLFDTIDTNTHESEYNSENLEYDADVSGKSFNDDVALVISGEDMSTDDSLR